jgi:CBS domain-containing protein
MVEKACDIMQIGVKTVEKTRSIYEAIRILVEHHISGLPVMDGQRMVGIITEKDVLQLVVRGEHLPGPVEQYMTRRVVAFDESDTIDKIWACLIEHSYRRVPITHDNKLTGIITRTDLIRARAANLGVKSSRGTSVLNGAEPVVQDVMTPGLLTTTPEALVGEAVQILLTNEITGLPVVDDSMRLVGILSEKDVLRLLGGGPAASSRVQDIMTIDVTIFNVNDSLFDVCECLAHNNFRRVPVLDHGKLVGILSRADLVMYILKNRSFLSRKRHTVAVG